MLCTDKTWTLTEGTIVLADATDPDGRTSPAVRQLALLNATFETGIDNPIDAAIVTAGEQAGLSAGGHATIDEIPYDFSRKRLTIVMAPGNDPRRHLVVTKGAFPLSPLEMATVVGIVIAYLAATESAKRWFYRAHGPTPG